MPNTPTPSAFLQLSLEEAIARVQAHANEDWMQKATSIVRELCESRSRFTTDDVWEKFKDTMYITGDPRALGAVMREAAKNGWCTSTGEYVKSSRPECHSRPIAVWQSEMFASDFLSKL